MSVTIYLIRHARKIKEWSYELNKDFDSEFIPLCTEGTLQSLLLAKNTMFKDVKQIYSSPSGRAIDTIKNIAEEINIPIVLRNNLIERKRIFTENFDDRSSLWENFDYHREGEESLNMVKERILSEIKYILDNVKEGKVLVCTHNMTIASLLKHYGFMDKLDEALSIKAPDMWEIIYENKQVESIRHVNLMLAQK